MTITQSVPATRVVWIDNVRALACVLVIILHVVASYLNQFNKINIMSWHLGNAIDSAVRVCVPLFFMISGFIFMSEKDMKVKHILKIIINLLLYSAIAFAYVLCFNIVDISKLSWATIAASYLKKPVFYHLWFFYTILVCYFFFAFLTIKNTHTTKALLFIFIIFILFNARTSSFTSHLFGFNYSGVFTIAGATPFFILYAALGAILGKENTRINFQYLYLSGFIVMSGFTAYLTYKFTSMNNKFIPDFYSYESFLVMFASVCIFLFIKTFKERLILGRLTTLIATTSLPIYGVHALILDFITLNKWRPDNIIIDLPATFLAVFGLSFGVSMIIVKLDRRGFFH